MSLIWLVIIVFFVLANLPWVNERLFLVFKLNQPKGAWFCVLEVVVYYFIAMLVATWIETQYAGGVYEQQWEFFVTTLSLFLVFAVPGVVYRHQWLATQKK